MKKRNICVAAFYVLFAVIGLVYTLSWKHQSTTGVNPNVWPAFWFIIIIIAALAYLLTLILKKEDTPVSESSKFHFKKSLPTIVWTGLYIFAFQRLGFVLSTMLYLPLEMILFGEKNWKPILLISLLLPICMYFLFTKVFSIYLPSLFL